MKVKLYKIVAKEKYHSCWRDEKLLSGGAMFTTYKDAKECKNKMQKFSSMLYKVEGVRI